MYVCSTVLSEVFSVTLPMLCSFSLFESPEELQNLNILLLITGGYEDNVF